MRKVNKISLEMSRGHAREKNTERLVMCTFHKLASSREGVRPKDIARFLQNRYGDVWKTSILIDKAERTLKRGTDLGFLDKRGDRYVENLARTTRCCRRRPRKCCCRRRPKRCCRRRKTRCRRRRRCSFG